MVLTDDEQDRVRQALDGYGSVVTEMEGALHAFREVIEQLQRGVPADEILTEKHLPDIDDAQRRLADETLAHRRIEAVLFSRQPGRKADQPMKNLDVFLPTVNEGQHLQEYRSGRHLIHEMLTDDWGAPPTALVFEAKTNDGRTVRIVIPYDETSPAYAVIVEESGA